MFYYTYVLECTLSNEDISLYIGYTSDLFARVDRHRRGLVLATKKYDSVTLVYYEACRSKIDALLREKALKTGYGRAFVKNRLKSDIDLRV